MNYFIHMSEAELIFTTLAELSTRQIAEIETATGLDENKTAAKTGGGIAKKARKELEAKTGNKIVTTDNYLSSAYKKLSEKIKPGKHKKHLNLYKLTINIHRSFTIRKNNRLRYQ